VRELQRVVEYFEIFVQGDGGSGQLLLVQGDVVAKPGRGFDEHDFPVVPQGHQNAVMEPGVLSNPRVAVVNVDHVDLLEGHRWQHHEPLLQELGSEPVLRAGVSEINDDVVGLVEIGLQAENDVVDQQISIRLTDFVPSRDVIKYRKSYK
jgi:hypothetical protein